MRCFTRWVKELFTVYRTPRIVNVKSTYIAIAYISLVFFAWASFLISLHLDVTRIYQATCPVRGVVISKVKGYADTTHLTEEELGIPHPEFYRRVWDQADLVYPSHGGEGETGSFTIVTNMVITPDQQLGTCPDEDAHNHPQLKCSDDSDCKPGFSSPNTHGIFTGKCDKPTSSCEIMGWCPVEQDILPMGEKKPLLDAVKDFTVLLKNTVEFPNCGGQPSNLLTRVNDTYLRTCRFNPKTDPLCPIFRIGDIVEWSNANFTSVAIKGGIFRIKIIWNCDFDFGKTSQDCQPVYEFVHVDDREAGRSPGWNFRSAEYFSQDKRTLRKQYALKILINVEGEGRKFDFFTVVMTLGATRGLFSLTHLICDFLVDISHNKLRSTNSEDAASQSEKDQKDPDPEPDPNEKPNSNSDTRVSKQTSSTGDVKKEASQKECIPPCI